jgi:hypothetical protein
MRYVRKDLDDIPPSLVSNKALGDIEKIAVADKTVVISDKIYKGTYKDSEGKSQSEVRDYLNKYYKNKCAYCEQYCKAEIEHYRPKKAVADDLTHNGYYWLCYTWSNLVPSCRYCNTEGGKGNKFPIINTTKRVRTPEFVFSKLDVSKCQASNAPLISEEPYLLHPEIDSYPENFLSFKISPSKNGVEIFGIDVKKRGATTIDICNLNRNDLKLNRLESVFYHIKKKIKLIFDLNATGQLANEHIGEAFGLIFKEIASESSSETLTHILLRRFIIENVHNFEQHFAPYLDSEIERNITVRAFKLYKTGSL